VDHTRISEELGGPDGHGRLLAALESHGMNHILDIVPNHMAVTERANKLWWEVLRDGPDSRYASFFDIDWDPSGTKLHRVVLVPILGDHYGRVLDSGRIRLERDGDGAVVRYFEHTLPISPASVTDDIDATIALVNSDVDALHGLLERQHYRLAYWKTAGEELNYRRFFAINDLVALRSENPGVFEHVHALVLELIRSGQLEGLRVDHVDGLRDPEDYLQRLRGEAPHAYIVVEKILESGETLANWPVEGTTGYDFLNEVFGVLVDGGAEKVFTDLYADFTDRSTDLETATRLKKLHLMRTELATDLERLTDLFVLVCESNRNYRDYTRRELRSALAETLAAFPIYRTYVRAGVIDPSDAAAIETATQNAAEQRPDLEPELMRFLADVLAARVEGDAETSLSLRFQQTSGAVMAKGVEDTFFYSLNRFVALNEVGGDPARFGIPVEDFHAAMEARATRWPAAMLATSTHDTKRSDDVRARLAVLTEIPEQWAAAVDRWSAHNVDRRDGSDPDANDEYLLYQTLVGTWPDARDTAEWTERIVAYMRKASKEAKEHTSWIEPDADYDAALEDFVRSILGDADFLVDLGNFVAPLVDAGWINSLTQTLVRYTAPGVPDTYQGQELWDLSLVDPDNRRPVDYAARRELLRWIGSATPQEVWERRDTGAPKLLVTSAALRLRRELADQFEGRYERIEVTGEAPDRAIAYRRGDRVIAVVPRLPLSTDVTDTSVELPPGPWRDLFTGTRFDGGRTAVTDLLAGFPVALLRDERS
jgi:(1->4)-alpha-D-glucan 1-alpha-D-glucosylmutase